MGTGVLALSGASGGAHHHVIDGTRGIGEAGMDVFAGEVRKVREQFLDADAIGERIQHVTDAHPGTGDDRPAAADLGVDGNARGHVIGPYRKAAMFLELTCYLPRLVRIFGSAVPVPSCENAITLIGRDAA